VLLFVAYKVRGLFGSVKKLGMPQPRVIVFYVAQQGGIDLFRLMCNSWRCVRRLVKGCQVVGGVVKSCSHDMHINFIYALNSNPLIYHPTQLTPTHTTNISTIISTYAA